MSGSARLTALGVLSLLLYGLLWIPAYRLNERFEYVDLLFQAYPWVAAVLATQLALVRAVAPWAVGSHESTALLFSALLIALFVAYLLALRLIRRVPRRVAVAAVIGSTLAFQFVLLPLPGVFTTDLFSYALYGEIAGRFGASPYVQVPDDYPTHPLYLLINPLWRDAPSVYGPLWIAFSSLVGAGLGGQVLGEILAYRLIADLSHWANLGLLWWALRHLRPGQEPLGVAMYAWNPLVVFEFAGSGHNDGTMVLFLVLSLGLLARGRRWLGVTAVVLAAAVKYTPALLLPIVLGWAVREERGWRRVGLAAAGGTAALAALAAAYLPWWRGVATFGPVIYWLSTPLYAHYTPVAVAGWVRDQMAAAGWPLDEAEQLVFGIQRHLLRLGYLAYLVAETLRLRRAEDIPLACARVMLVYLLAVNTWVLPWYFTWPLALVALGDPRSRTTRVAVGFSISAPLAMYWGQVRFEPMPAAGYLVYLAPLAGLVAWEAWRWLAPWYTHSGTRSPASVPALPAEDGAAPTPLAPSPPESGIR